MKVYQQVPEPRKYVGSGEDAVLDVAELEENNV